MITKQISKTYIHISDLQGYKSSLLSSEKRGFMTENKKHIPGE